MSSLLASYRKITDPTNQGIFNNEELLLSQGRVYQGGVIERTFGGAAVLNFILTAGVDFVAISKADFISDSEEFKIELFVNPVFTDGTPIPLFNQLLGSPRPALSSLLIAPSISDEGTPGTVTLVRGVSGQGNSSGAAQGGIESLAALIPNTKLLLRITNQGTAGQLDVRIRLGEFPVTI